LEVILVNDGSTDQSAIVAQEYIEKTSPPNISFKLIENSINSGISHAKNQGMSKMNGEYFFFAGSDDIHFPDRISVPLAYLANNPDVDIVYSDCELWHNSNGTNKFSRRGFPLGMTNENSFLYQLKRSYLWSGLLFARRSAYLEFDEELSSAVDYDWYFKHYFKGSLVHFIDHPLARYRLHENNTSKNLSKSTKNVFKILNKYDFETVYDNLRASFELEELNISFAWYYFSINKFDKAIKKLTSVSSDNFDKHFLQGIIFALGEEFPQATESFQSICDKFPENTESLNNLAVCLLKSQKRTPIACKLLKNALKLNPNYLDARYNLKAIESSKAHLGDLKLTLKPLRSELTHIDNYDSSAKDLLDNPSDYS
jgi:glycosyltransferase involved in cell wall biosynthesis